MFSLLFSSKIEKNLVKNMIIVAVIIYLCLNFTEVFVDVLDIVAHGLCNLYIVYICIYINIVAYNKYVHINAIKYVSINHAV